jgi:hypothetical protein
MKKQEVRDLIYSELDKILSSTGFRLVKTDEAFVRAIPEGKQKIYVSLIDYNPRFIFSLTVGIRLNAVEDIFNLFSGADQKSQKYTVTSLTQLEYFTGRPKSGFTVTSEAEIKSAISELQMVLISKIMPFLDKYTDIRSLDTAMNVEQLQDFDTSMPNVHAMHSIILTKLAGNPDYRKLVSKYEDAMRNFTQFDKDRFSNLVRYMNEKYPDA